jgi:hypothetical protein
LAGLGDRDGGEGSKEKRGETHLGDSLVGKR